MLFAIGSYTSLGGPGLVLARLQETGVVVLQTDAVDDPSYLIPSGDRRLLYVVSKGPIDHPDEGSVLTYRLSGLSMQQIRAYGTGAQGPTHLCLSPDERFLVTAQYASGTVSVFPLQPPGPRLQLIRHQGHGPHPQRQQGPHVHQVSFIPGTDCLLAVDLGADRLFVYRQDLESGRLVEWKSLAVPPGWGPRHVAYGPDHSLYVVHELANRVSLLSLKNLSFETLATYSTVPAGWHEANTAAAVRLHAGRLWVSNRGHDSLAAFPVNRDGRLGEPAFFPTGDRTPRDVAWLDDKRVLIAHQSGSLVIQAWDHKAQRLTPLSRLAVPGAVCVCPLGPVGQP